MHGRGVAVDLFVLQNQCWARLVVRNPQSRPVGARWSPGFNGVPPTLSTKPFTSTSMSIPLPAPSAGGCLGNDDFSTLGLRNVSFSEFYLEPLDRLPSTVGSSFPLIGASRLFFKVTKSSKLCSWATVHNQKSTLSQPFQSTSFIRICVIPLC